MHDLANVVRRLRTALDVFAVLFLLVFKRHLTKTKQFKPGPGSNAPLLNGENSVKHIHCYVTNYRVSTTISLRPPLGGQLRPIVPLVGRYTALLCTLSYQRPPRQSPMCTFPYVYTAPCLAPLERLSLFHFLTYV